MNMEEYLKASLTLEARQRLSKMLIEKHPGCIPIIVDRGNDRIPDLRDHKFMVPYEQTIQQFALTIRQQLKLNAAEAIFYYNGEKLLPLQCPVSNLFSTYKDEDGFMYIRYLGQDAFG